MGRTKALIVAVTCFALAAVLAWQQRSDASVAAPPVTLQLIAPAKAKSRPPEAAAAPASAPALEAKSAAAANSKKRTTRPGARPEKVIASSRTTAVAPLAAAVAVTAPVTKSSYDKRVADATTIGRDDADRAIALLQQLTTEEPSHPEAYSALAAIRMRQGDYRSAGELLESALRNGGAATFTLVHDHSKGNFEKDPKASCVGELIVTPSEIKFSGNGAGDSHQFDATWEEVLDAGSNRFFGSGIGGFHVTIKPDGKYQNFNLAPNSKDKAEAKLIVDLVKANARRQDRGK